MATAFEMVDYASMMSFSNYVGIDDFADKLSFFYTVLVFLVCTAVVTLKQYIMKSIACYVANPIGGENLVDYLENYCWIQGTIPNPYTMPLPDTLEKWNTFNKNRTVYYHWVPVMLGFQGMLFYAPRFIWQMLCYNQPGTNLQHLAEGANNAIHSDAKSREKMVKHLAYSLEQLLYQHRVIGTGKFIDLRHKLFHYCGFFVISKRLGTWLMFSYMALKMLYLVNAVGQIYIMQHFLGIGENFNPNYTFFGVEIVKHFIEGKDWETTMVFPRVGFCYAPIKQLGSLNGAVAQCALPANLLNEKIYIFLWFWIVMVFIVTAISIPTWLIRMSVGRNRSEFIEKFFRLKFTHEEIEKDNDSIKKFIIQFLRHDGIFLLRMISLNAGDIVTADIVKELWNTYRTKYSNSNFLEGPDEEATD